MRRWNLYLNRVVSILMVGLVLYMLHLIGLSDMEEVTGRMVIETGEFFRKMMVSVSAFATLVWFRIYC